MKRRALGFLIASICVFSSAQAQVHEAARMLAPPASESNEPEDTGANRAEILSGFQQVYNGAGKPRIAVFWNRQFDDQLSQWFQLARRTSSAGVDLSAQDSFQTEGTDPASYERSVSGQGEVSASDYLEVRVGQQQRAGFNEADGFKFASGFTSAFLNVPAKVVDRAAVMRLIQRQQEKQGGAEDMADVQKIETDSLVGFADYLTEILLTPDSDSETGWAFMVSVKSVQNGQVVAMFHSAAELASKGAPKISWEATPNGYQKVEEEQTPPTLAETGEQLGYETMQALSKIL
ncbi:hypothetical protein DXV75_03455 [Alteromonas aestuariivivens]|uniref:Uncharacterized protein n=1 Tax=Alteromonas aestuariivivens TaxID=1938339 RepID=A0A3D8MC04_9ALTE|nr:hypothetical protein [Alteromonas aestuariivivens]RDV28034.1 hypothetical protein DXV75_03455 [Alteromonas aestuariivivens]